MLVAQVGDDGGAFADDMAVIDQHRHLAARIDFKEFRRARLPLTFSSFTRLAKLVEQDMHRHRAGAGHIIKCVHKISMDCIVMG